MDYETTRKINEAIEQGLPAAVGKVLQDRLAQADKDAAEVKRLTERVTKLDGELVLAKLDLQSHGDLGRRRAETDAKTAALLVETGKKEIIDAKLACAQSKVDFAREVVALVFGNNRFKYQSSGSEPAGIRPPQYPGGPHEPTTVYTDRKTEGEA